MSTFNMKQGDTNPSIAATLTIDGIPINLTGCSIRFRMWRNDINVGGAAIIIDPVLGKVAYDFQPSDAAIRGMYRCEWIVTAPTGKSQTVPNSGYNYVEVW